MPTPSTPRPTSNPDRAMFFDRFEALTFDDVVIVPGYSEVLPDSVDTSATFARDIQLALPLVSAAPLAAGAPSAMERAVNANPRVTNASRVSRQPVTGVARELPSSQLDPDLSAMQGTRVVVEARGGRPMVTIPQVTYGAQRAVMRQSASADVAAIQTVF